MFKPYKSLQDWLCAQLRLQVLPHKGAQSQMSRGKVSFLSSSQTLLSPLPGHDFCLSPGEAFCVVKWRNSLTDCSLCLILQIRTSNRLNCSADLFLMSATHYLTFGSWFQMWSYWLVANTGLSLGLYNPLGLFSEVLPSFSYVTKGTFLISHQNWVFSKFRPEKLFSKLTHCTLTFVHL